MSTNLTYIKKNRITDNIELRLDVEGKTQVFLYYRNDWHYYSQCMFLLIDLPAVEDAREVVQTEGWEIISIDEAGKKYGRDLETNSDKIEDAPTPEEAFWGHCSNFQAWVENDYNPNIMHSSMTRGIYNKLCEESKDFFIRLLKTLDKNWSDLRKSIVDSRKRFKTSKGKEKNNYRIMIKANIDRREHMFKTYFDNINYLSGQNGHNVTQEEMLSIKFVRDFVMIKGSAIIKKRIIAKITDKLKAEIEGKFEDVYRELRRLSHIRPWDIVDDEKNLDRKFRTKLNRWELKLGYRTLPFESKYYKYLKRRQGNSRYKPNSMLNMERDGMILRKYLRDIRNHKEYTTYSDEIDYPAYLFAKGKFKQIGNMHFYLVRKEYVIIRNSEGEFRLYDYY